MGRKPTDIFGADGVQIKAATRQLISHEIQRRCAVWDAQQGLDQPHQGATLIASQRVIDHDSLHRTNRRGLFAQGEQPATSGRLCGWPIREQVTEFVRKAF